MPSLSRRVFKDNHNVTYFASASRNGENRIVTSGDRSGFSILNASANRLLKRNIRITNIVTVESPVSDHPKRQAKVVTYGRWSLAGA